MSFKKIAQNGPLLMTCASFIFSVMGALIKYTGTDIPFTEIVFFRSIFSLILLTTLAFIFQTPLLNKQYKFLILRGIFGFCAFTIFYFALTQIHLTKVSIIMQTRPFFVMVLAYIFLKERLSARELYFLIISFVGVLFMLRTEHGTLSIDYTSLICLLGVFFAASSAVIVKHVTATIPSICIVFYFMLTSSVCSLPLVIHDYVFLSRNQILLLILISVLSTFAQFLMTEAIRFSKATIAVVVGYIGVIFSTLWEFLFWNALPDLFTVLGGIFIGIAVAFLATQKTKHYSA